ncbi:MAG: glycine betaine ABC transporter substrate-binding protein, partial [Chthoniobacterales bacterium]
MKIFAAILLATFSATAVAEPTVIVGSKKFTESYVLGEIAKRALEHAGFQIDFRPGMGGTIIVWEALRTGRITLYPDYTGTVVEEILKQPGLQSEEAIRDALAPFGVGMTRELGFNNTWALVMRRAVAEAAHVHTISDLRAHPELRFGLTHEFLDRRDGWQPLAQRYQLAAQDVRGIDHALGYEALAKGEIDVKDAYSTDAKIAQNNLVTLADNLQFFPQYKAVFLYRLDAPPRAIAALRQIEGTLDEQRMRRLNAEAEQTKDYARAAALYFGDAEKMTTTGEAFPHKLMRWTLRHLQLAGISLLLSIIVGIPLGIIASRGGWIGHTILAVTSTVQTIPSLALLALLIPIPFFGISPRTAIAALFLYGLLPIVRNTAVGLQDIAQPIRDSATALGLEPRARLRKIYLPMASRTILGGIKTSAVINIGTATLAAL